MRPEQISSMLLRLRLHLTYANVMSTIAVFLALGGGALAAGGGNDGGGDKGSHHQGDGSAGNGAGDQGGGNGGNDNQGKGHGGKGNNGGNGDNTGGSDGGGNNSTGDTTTPNGSFNVTTHEGDPVAPDRRTDLATATASCTDGETLIGGGVRTPPGKGQPLVTSSGPDGDKWTATVYDNSGSEDVKVTAYAICASGSSSSANTGK
jgi:hypothetical protein